MAGSFYMGLMLDASHKVYVVGHSRLKESDSSLRAAGNGEFLLRIREPNARSIVSLSLSLSARITLNCVKY